MVIVLNHYNTYRKSPYGESWQDTIFRCLRKFPNIKKIIIDWGSSDGSNISAIKICKQYGYKYKEINIKNKKFSWFDYFCEWQKIVLDSTNEAYILYVEADTYIGGTEEQLIKSKNILESNKDIGLVKMTRLCHNGIVPFYVEKKINNGFLLPKFKYDKNYLKFKTSDVELLSSMKYVRRCWHNWDTKCTIFRFYYVISALKDLRRTKSYRKDKKRGFYNFGLVFCNKYRCSIGDYIFSYNYGSKKIKDYSRSISILDKNYDKKIIDICEDSILYYKK